MHVHPTANNNWGLFLIVATLSICAATITPISSNGPISCSSVGNGFDSIIELLPSATSVELRGCNWQDANTTITIPNDGAVELLLQNVTMDGGSLQITALSSVQKLHIMFDNCRFTNVAHGGSVMIQSTGAPGEVARNVSLTAFSQTTITATGTALSVISNAPIANATIDVRGSRLEVQRPAAAAVDPLLCFGCTACHVAAASVVAPEATGSAVTLLSGSTVAAYASALSTNWCSGSSLLVGAAAVLPRNGSHFTGDNIRIAVAATDVNVSAVVVDDYDSIETYDTATAAAGITAVSREELNDGHAAITVEGLQIISVAAPNALIGASSPTRITANGGDAACAFGVCSSATRTNTISTPGALLFASLSCNENLSTQSSSSSHMGHGLFVTAESTSARAALASIGIAGMLKGNATSSPGSLAIVASKTTIAVWGNVTASSISYTRYSICAIAALGVAGNGYFFDVQAATATSVNASQSIISAWGNITTTSISNGDETTLSAVAALGIASTRHSGNCHHTSGTGTLDANNATISANGVINSTASSIGDRRSFSAVAALGIAGNGYSGTGNGVDLDSNNTLTALGVTIAVLGDIDATSRSDGDNSHASVTAIGISGNAYCWSDWGCTSTNAVDVDRAIITASGNVSALSISDGEHSYASISAIAIAANSFSDTSNVGRGTTGLNTMNCSGVVVATLGHVTAQSSNSGNNSAFSAVVAMGISGNIFSSNSNPDMKNIINVASANVVALVNFNGVSNSTGNRHSSSAVAAFGIVGSATGGTASTSVHAANVIIAAWGDPIANADNNGGTSCYGAVAALGIASNALGSEVNNVSAYNTIHAPSATITVSGSTDAMSILFARTDGGEAFGASAAIGISGNCMSTNGSNSAGTNTVYARNTTVAVRGNVSALSSSEGDRSSYSSVVSVGIAGNSHSSSSSSTTATARSMNSVDASNATVTVSGTLNTTSRSFGNQYCLSTLAAVGIAGSGHGNSNSTNSVTAAGSTIAVNGTVLATSNSYSADITHCAVTALSIAGNSHSSSVSGRPSSNNTVDAAGVTLAASGNVTATSTNEGPTSFSSVSALGIAGNAHMSSVGPPTGPEYYAENTIYAADSTVAANGTIRATPVTVATHTSNSAVAALGIAGCCTDTTSSSIGVLATVVIASEATLVAWGDVLASCETGAPSSHSAAAALGVAAHAIGGQGGSCVKIDGLTIAAMGNSSTATARSSGGAVASAGAAIYPDVCIESPVVPSVSVNAFIWCGDVANSVGGLAQAIKGIQHGGTAHSVDAYCRDISGIVTFDISDLLRESASLPLGATDDYVVGLIPPLQFPAPHQLDCDAATTASPTASTSALLSRSLPRTPQVSMTSTGFKSRSTLASALPESQTSQPTPQPSTRPRPERIRFNSTTAVVHPELIFDVFAIDVGTSNRRHLNVSVSTTGQLSYSIDAQAAVDHSVCVAAVLATAHEFLSTAQFDIDASSVSPRLGGAIELGDYVVMPRQMKMCIPPLSAAPTMNGVVVASFNDAMAVFPSAPSMWAGGGVEIVFIGSPREQAVPSAVAIAASGGTAAAVALGGAGPGVGAAAQRQQLLRKVAVCPRPLDLDPPPPESSPTRWAVSDSALKHHVGAAYGNLLVCVGYAALLAVGVEVMARFVQTEGFTISAAQSVSLRLLAASNLGFPGKLAPVWIFLYQPTLSAALAVAVHADDASVLHRALCSVLVVILFAVFLVLPLLFVRRLVIDCRTHNLPAAIYLPFTQRQCSKLRRRGGCMYRVLGTPGIWVSRQMADPTLGDSNEDEDEDQEKNKTPFTVLFAERIGPAFDGLRPECVFLIIVDSAVATVAACVEAYSPRTAGECRWLYVGVVAVFLTAAVASMVRPYQRTIDNVAFALLSWLQLLVAVAMLTITRGEGAEDSWSNAMQICDTALRALVLIWTAVQVAEAIYEFATAKNAESSSNQIAQLRVAADDRLELHDNEKLMPSSVTLT